MTGIMVEVRVEVAADAVEVSVAAAADTVEGMAAVEGVDPSKEPTV